MKWIIEPVDIDNISSLEGNYWIYYVSKEKGLVAVEPDDFGTTSLELNHRVRSVRVVDEIEAIKILTE